MLNLLRTEGITPIIYTNKDGYQRFVKGHLEDYPLWISSFTDPPLGDEEGWDMWQYSHRGTSGAIEGPVDFNTVNPASSLASLRCLTLKTPRKNN